MSIYFTRHHFSPRRNPPHHLEAAEDATKTTTIPVKDPDAPGAPGSQPEEIERHRLHSGLEGLSKFLHAFNLHLSDNETHRDVVHPHFDLVESKTTYTVYGELPGLSKDNVIVEANDHLFTVTVSGQLKRPVPEGAEGSREIVGNVGVVHRDADGTDKDGEKAEQTGEMNVANDGKKEGEHETKEKSKEPEQELLWHVTERRVGQFRRAFQFPIELVDMAAVRASMQNGLLFVVIPKKAADKKMHEARKVAVVQGDVQARTVASENP